MNTYKHRLFNREISMQVLCGLTWINVALSAIILIQHQTIGSQKAYLIGRTPADFVTHNAAQERENVTIRDVIERSDDTLASSSSSPWIETESVPSSFSSITASSRSSESSRYSESSESSSSSEASAMSAIAFEATAEGAKLEGSSESSESSTSFISISSDSLVSSSFPAFGNAVHPVSEVPDWGAMTKPSEWDRSYSQMKDSDFVAIPKYNLGSLMIPMKELLGTRDQPETIKLLTAKLYYSTRFFGAYDLDAGEFSAIHPGIDVKLPEGTPIGAVAGGRVHDVRHDDQSLGLHVIVEHHAKDGLVYYSIYGHLATTAVQKGDILTSGQFIGTVGMTGNTSGPHLHLQIDRGEANEDYHTIYWPTSLPTKQEANRFCINPISFIQQY